MPKDTSKVTKFGRKQPKDLRKGELSPSKQNHRLSAASDSAGVIAEDSGQPAVAN